MGHVQKLFAAAVALAICSTVMAAEVDNPEYKDWAKYKEGTSITMKQGIEAAMPANANMPAGMDMSAMLPQTTIKTTLVSVKPEEVTLEVSTTTSQMGRSQENKTTRKVPAKIQAVTTAPATMSAATQGVSTTMKAVKEGKDTVEVSGKKIETTTREYDADSTVGPGAMAGAEAGTAPGGMRGRGGGMSVASHIKIWNSADVPGGLVKMESTSNVPGMGEMKQSMTLVDFTPGK